MAELSSKDLVKSLFRLEDLPRIPFIPWVCSFAAQLEQVQVEDMLSDAGLLATSLSNAQKLFGYDAICNVFDSSLEAEALGCEVEWGGEGDLPTVASHPLAEGARLEDISVLGLDARGRIPVVIEATRRLNIVMGKQVAVIGVVTGPVTLAGHLSGKSFLNDLTERPEDAGRTIALAGVACLNLARKYCELGVDAVAVADEMLGQIGPAEYRLAAGPLKSIWNVAKFYNVRTLLLGRGCSERQAVSILGLGADGVAVSGDYRWRTPEAGGGRGKALLRREHTRIISFGGGFAGGCPRQGVHGRAGARLLYFH